MGRFPDGRDEDSLCTDFVTQAVTALAAASAAGATNVKVAGAAGFSVGQTIVIDSGASLETVVIAAVGTPGATTASAPVSAGATTISVSGAAGFAAGQTVTVDDGADRETAVVLSAAGGRGGATITVTAPLTRAHPAGAPISGSGITLTAALTKPHATGVQVAGNTPTPGAANQYSVPSARR